LGHLNLFIVSHNIGTIVAVHLANFIPEKVKGIVSLSCFSPSSGWTLPSLKDCITLTDV